MSVAPGGVGLPDLDQAVPDRTPVAIEDPPGDDDPLPQRLTRMLAGQIMVQLPDRATSKRRTRSIREGPRKNNQRSLRRPEACPHVIRVEIRGLNATILAPSASSFHPPCQAASPFPVPFLHQFSTLRLRLRLSARSGSACACQHVQALRLSLVSNASGLVGPRFQLFAYQASPSHTRRTITCRRTV
jgi:hypothetical protein